MAVVSGFVAFMSGYQVLFRVSASRPPKKMKLHTQYFTKGVVSLLVGFSRKKRVKDMFARCRLCREHLMIQNQEPGALCFARALDE